MNVALHNIKIAKQVLVLVCGKDNVYYFKVSKKEALEVVKQAGEDLEVTMYDDGQVVIDHPN